MRIEELSKETSITRLFRITFIRTISVSRDAFNKLRIGWRGIGFIINTKHTGSTELNHRDRER